MIEIKNSKVYINIEGKMKETTDPTLIGFAVLDWAEKENVIEIKSLQDIEY
jgi:hypothetical protein